ncbi:MAG: hypothetical protein WCM93_16575, partial [Bacteroidota bacterium]
GTGLFMYTNDYNDYFPTASYNQWPWEVQKQLKLKNSVLEANEKSNIFTCPSVYDPGKSAKWISSNDASLVGRRAPTYTATIYSSSPTYFGTNPYPGGAVCGMAWVSSNATNKPRKKTSQVNPNSPILIESAYARLQGNIAAGPLGGEGVWNLNIDKLDAQGLGGDWRRHSLSNNFLMGGGHVKTMKLHPGYMFSNDNYRNPIE